MQLPNYARTSNDWPTVREAMRATLADLPNTGMVVTIDICDADDIHPTNKQEVARRLALWALSFVYGREGEYSGPLEGERIVVPPPDGGFVASARYAWENNPDGNLFNGVGLPASPFSTGCPLRTDSEC